MRVLEAPRNRTAGLWRFVDSFGPDGIAEERTRPGPQGDACRYPVFRLRSIDDLVQQPGLLPAPDDPRRIRARRVERSDLLHRSTFESPLDGERPETRLPKAFDRFLAGQGYAVHRLAIHYTPDRAPMLTDEWIAQLSLRSAP